MATAKPKKIGWGAMLAKKQKDKENANKESPKVAKKTSTTDAQTTKQESNTTKNDSKIDKTPSKTKLQVQNQTSKNDTKTKETDIKNNTPTQKTNPKQNSDKPSKITTTPTKKLDTKQENGDNTTNQTNKKRTNEEITVKTNGGSAKKIKVEEGKKKETTEDHNKKQTTQSPKSILKTPKSDPESKDMKGEAKADKKEDKIQTFVTAYEKEEEERKKKEAKKFQKDKNTLRGVLGARKFFEFSDDGPIVVYLHPETKPGEHEFYVNLLAKSYVCDFSDSVSYKTTKMVLGFDVEYFRGAPITIQLSTNTLSLVLNLYPPNGSRQSIKSLSPSFHNIFSGINYIKAGVGVPQDMGVLKKHYNISLEGMFDISFFAIDMQLTSVPWQLEVLGMDLLDIGKIFKFSANGIDLNNNQIEYAARDAWVGYKLTECLFGYFGMNFSSMHSWARAYSQNRQRSFEEASKTKPNEAEEKKEEESKGESGENEESEEEQEKEKKGEVKKKKGGDSEESDSEEEEKKEKGGNEKGSKKSNEDSVSAAIKKGVAIAQKGKQSERSNEVAGIRHVLRNKLESIKAARRKAEIEEDTFTRLMDQLSNKTTGEDDEEDMGTVFNWV